MPLEQLILDNPTGTQPLPPNPAATQQQQYCSTQSELWPSGMRAHVVPVNIFEPRTRTQSVSGVTHEEGRQSIRLQSSHRA